MPKQRQIRGTTQATQEGRTLTSRELDINTTDDRLAVHDGSTAGGIPHINYRDHLNQEYTYAAAAGTDTITMSLAIAPAAYAQGQAFKFKAANTVTGSATLNVNSLGAKTIKKKDVAGGTVSVLSAGDIVGGGIYTATYDGTDMILESIDSGGAGFNQVSSTNISGAVTAVTLQDIFTSGKNYRIIISNMEFDNDSEGLHIIGLSSGTTEITAGGSYRISFHGTRQDGTTESGNEDGVGTNGAITNTDIGSATDEGLCMELFFFDPADTGNPARFTYHGSYEDAAGDAVQISGGGQVGAGAQTMAGIKLLAVLGNTDNGNIIVFEEDAV